jgi:hypothetical protein
MKKLLIAIFFISIGVFAQVNEESFNSGIITYKTKSQVYVTFKSTDGINKGDTLFVKNRNNMIPALIVATLSKTSCAGKGIVQNLDIDTKIYVIQKNEFNRAVSNVEKNDKVAAGISEPKIKLTIPESEIKDTDNDNKQINKNKPTEIVEEKIVPDSEVTSRQSELISLQTTEVNDKPVIILSETPAEIIRKKKVDDSETKELKSSVVGKISVQSYSNLSNLSRELSYQRWRYAFQLTANNIGSTRLSYSHYINFAYRASDWNTVTSNLGNAIRIYDLSLRYDFNDRTNVTAGRHINRKVSNVSMVDGLQFETGVSSWSFGVITGARPDYRNLGFNLNLLEYGAYIYKTDTLGFGNMQNTISLFEQTNHSKTDRRFLYFQHTNSLIQNTRIFLSSEVDLFKKELGVSKSDFSLTSLYASVNIRPSDIVSFNLSYDARKNVIYYETFKTFADSVYENETRQGFRARVSLRAVKGLYINGNYGYRFRKGDAKPSRNYGGSLSYYKIPVVDLRIGTDFSWLSTSYIDGTIWGISLSRDISNGANLSVDYRNTIYDFNKTVDKLKQHSVSINLSLSLLRPVYLGLTYEGVFEDTRTSGRVLTNLSYRF